MTAVTQENLTALEKALFEGARRVKYQDKEIEYRTVDEMVKLRDMMKRELGLIDPNRKNTKVALFSNGL